MVVAPHEYAGAGEGLVLGEDGEDAEDDGDARVEGDAHEAVGDAVGDVLEVHRLALDQHADGDDGVEGAAGRGGRCQGGQVRGRAAQEVAGCAAAGGGGLDLGGGVESVVGGRGARGEVGRITRLALG